MEAGRDRPSIIQTRLYIVLIGTSGKTGGEKMGFFMSVNTCIRTRIRYEGEKKGETG